MGDYKKYLRTFAAIISLLFIGNTCDAQLFGCDGPADGFCDSLGAGEQIGLCADCEIAIGTFTGPPIKPSAGDDPCIATPLKTGLACTQYSNDTSTATTNPGTPSCWSSVVNDVWFSFVATAEDMTVSTDAVIFELFPGTANNDTEIALYGGSSCSSLTELNCNQDEGINSGIDLTAGTSSPTRQALVERTGLTVGDTYYIRVQGVSGGVDPDGIGNFCVSAFDTYTVGSKACEAQAIRPNNIAGTCDYNNGNAVKNKVSSGAYDAATTMQGDAYVPLGTTFSCAPQITADMYGGWVKWSAEDNSDITVENISGQAMDYTLFEATICINLQCINSNTGIAPGATTSFSGITAGTQYYLLSTLASGATSDGFVTDVCIRSSTVPFHPETEKNEGGVPGAGGTQQADQCPAFEIVVDQVYETTTYAADVDGAASCAYGKNVWFTWKVPADYPSENGAQAAFFQMWSKNCTGGPGSPGTRLIVGAAILGDPCSGSCLEFSSPSQTGAAGSSGDIDPYTDASTNVGWDPSQYGNQYWGVFQSGNDGSGQEVCDFNFMIGSTPSLKGITVPDATICLGESVSLTASGATGYEWHDGQTGDTYTDSPTTNTSYTVYATAGAEGYSVGYVTVITPPVVTVNSGGICSGATALTLTASGAEIYEWTPETALTSTVGVTVDASPSTTTVYTVTGINGRVTGSYEGRDDFAGCSATADATVTVGGSIPIQVNDGVVCAGESAALTASGGDTYVWTPATGLDATTGTTVNASPATTTTYTVTGTSNGCDGTAESAVTISPAAVVTVNNIEVCDGLTATLTASGGDTYVWDDASTGDQLVTPPVTGTTNYTVTGTDANGCTDTAIATVALAAGLTVTVNDGVLCAGGAGATLNASGGTTYDWLPDDGSLSAVTGTSVVATPTVTTTYTVTGNTSGCTGEAQSTVSITPLDDATFTYSGATFCAPSSDTPTKVSNGTFTISPAGDLAIDANTGFIDVIAGSTVQHYDVTLTTTDACPNTSTVGFDVVGNPDATFSYGGPYCQSDPNATITQPAGSTPGNFTATPAGLVFISPTSGEVDLAASAAGNYTVTNTIPAGNGCPAAMETSTIDITETPVVTATSATICEADPAATISASDAGGSGTITYAWTGGGTPSGADLSDSPATTTTYTVIGNDNGCNSIPAEGTITVNPLPTITVSSISTCAGVSATITASGGTSYTWAGGGTPSGADLSDGPTATTTYTATGTDAAGCFSTGEGTITVPSAVTLSISPDEVTICTGSTGAALTANGAAAYSWNTGETTPGIQVNPTTTTTYTVTESGAGGCAAVATATVTVNTTPTVSVASDIGCEGDAVTITASGDADGYVWSDASTGATLTDSPAAGINTYTVTATIGGNCPVTATGTIAITATPTVTVNDASICEGQTATLTASGASSYTWSPNVGSTATVAPAPTTATSFTVTGDVLGCTATAVSNVTVDATPTITVSSDSVCAGDAATLTANGAVSYTWLPGGNTGATITVNPTQTTTYTVTGLTAASCPGTGTGTVTAYPLPVAAFNDPATINLSEADILFSDQSSNAGAWAWDFGDGSPTALSTSQNPQHIYADTGLYNISLIVVSPGGCVDSVLHDIYIVPDVIVFIPNSFTPDGDELNDGFAVKGAGIQEDSFELRIFDRWGEQVFHTKDIYEQWIGDNDGGDECQQDVYVYILTIKDNFGKEKKYLGNITLLR